MDAAVLDDSTNNVEPDEAGPTCKLPEESNPDTANDANAVGEALTMFVPSQNTASVLLAGILTPVPAVVLNVTALAGVVVLLLTKYNFVIVPDPLGDVGLSATVPPPVPVSLTNMARDADVLAVPIGPKASVPPEHEKVVSPEMAVSMKFEKL